MNASSPAAARAERITAAYRRDTAERLAHHHDKTGAEYPISGDMIAVMHHEHPSRYIRRRRTFARIENWNTN